jgi:hypothetical protein
MPHLYNDIVVVTKDELVPNWFTWDSLRKKLERGSSNPHGIKSVRKGGGGHPLLISFSSLPKEIQEGLGGVRRNNNQIVLSYELDAGARKYYFEDYEIEAGKTLKPEVSRQYMINASVLNAIIKVYASTKSYRRKLGGKPKMDWATVVSFVEDSRDELGHTLPKQTLRRVLDRYISEGYSSIISGKYGNDNSRKVNTQIENMILSIYTMDNKHFASSVHEIYNLFLTGKVDIVNRNTGEVFDRADFTKNGQPLEISDTTVWNYLNKPSNRIIVDKYRLDAHEFNNVHRPHARRHAPNYSFSKVSMDDRDLPRKLIGGGRVKAYYAYDVTSGAIIGRSYSRDKDEELFLDCLRDMFRLMTTNVWGVPMEVEVEHHLVNKFFDDLAVMFPTLRICRAGNSQEKHAEHFNKAKKYGSEKDVQKGIGRWWAKSEAYRTKSNKVSDEFVERGYDYKRLVADDEVSVINYNNELHPKQDKFPNMTRWQVLEHNLNPELTLPNKAVWLKSIGNKTSTSLKRSKYITVQYQEYELPSSAISSKLQPNNHNVDAYWLANEDGEIEEIYIYQNGEYLCRCEKSQTWNTAKAEWTDTDAKAQSSQAKYTAEFDKMVKEGVKNKLFKAEIIKIEDYPNILEAKEDIIMPTPKLEEYDVEALVAEYNNNEYTQQAFRNI